MDNLTTPYSLERHLQALCAQDGSFDNLLATWSLNKRSCAEGLKTVAQNFPHYSVHDDRHSETILSNMEMLLGEKRIAVLSPTDTWLLLQVAYLHDFGMALLYERVESVWGDEDFQDYLKELRESFNPSLKEASLYLNALHENLGNKDFEKSWPLKVRRYTTQVIAGYFRGKHADLSAAYAEQMKTCWGIDLTHSGLIPGRLIKLIGRISSLHTRDTKEVLELDYRTDGYGADYAHPRFIAEMLRLGDLLDADNGRFSDTAERVTGELPEDAKLHKGKHEATQHILITPQQVEYRADCDSPAVYREARRFLTWLDDELTFAAVHWGELVPAAVGGSAPRLTRRELLLNGKRDLEGMSDLRFGISQERAFDIIEGANLYEDKMVFLRELVQNAEDASKVQLWRDLNAKQYEAWMPKKLTLDDLQPYDLPEQIFRNYPITIDLRDLENGDIEICVTDRGTGMNVDTFKQMCQVGESFRADRERRREIETMPAWLRPTSGFGIGLQSIFLAAPRFDIYTRAEGRALHAAVESRKREGYVQVEEAAEPKLNGTQVRVAVKDTESYYARRNVLEYVEKYDWLGEKDERFLWSIVDTIEKYCAGALFPIVINHGGKRLLEIEPISFAEFQDTGEADERPGKVKMEGDWLYILSEDCQSIKLWKRTESIYASLGWAINHGRERIRFKGKSMENERMAFPVVSVWLNAELDFYGLDTKQYLALNREGFRAEYRQEIRKLVDACISFYTAKIVERLCTKTKEEQQILAAKVKLEATIESKREKRSFPWVVWNLCTVEQQKTLYQKCRPFMEQACDSVEMFIRSQDEGEMEFSLATRPAFVLLQELYDGGGLCCLYHANNYLFTSEQKCSGAKWIYFPKRDLVNDDCFNGYTIKNLWYLPEKDRWTVTEVGLAEAPFEITDNQTRKNVMTHLKNERSFTARVEFPPMERYHDLAVAGRPSDWGLALKQKIISPILKSDEEARGGLSEQAFVDSIIRRNDFARLVEHVCTERGLSEEQDKEHIRALYTEFIHEYYQVMWEFDQEAREKEKRETEETQES